MVMLLLMRYNAVYGHIHKKLRNTSSVSLEDGSHIKKTRRLFD